MHSVDDTTDIFEDVVEIGEGTSLEKATYE